MKYSVILILFSFLTVSCQQQEPSKQLLTLFQNQVDTLDSKILQLHAGIKANESEKSVQLAFLDARLAYKGLEAICEFYFPSLSKSMNGAAIDEYEEEEGKVLPPEGFQVIETYLFPRFQKEERNELIKESAILVSNMVRLQRVSESLVLSDANIFEAIRLELIRITALGVSGFDAPIAQNSIDEAKTALDGIQLYLSFYISKIEKKDSALKNQLASQMGKSRQFLTSAKNFETFDRASFIADGLNPLSSNILILQNLLGITGMPGTASLKLNYQHIFAPGVFNQQGFLAFAENENSEQKIALGKLLFNEKRISSVRTRSCADCHNSNKSFTDGLKIARTLVNKSPILRNTPTVMYAGYQRSLFYDSRVSYLEDQAVDVIQNVNEMHGNMDDIVNFISTDKVLAKSYRIAFPDKNINSKGILNALASYMRSLGNFSSKMDKFMNGDKKALNQLELSGFNLYMGKAKCGTCHFMPLTNGTVPPMFDKSESEVLGVPNHLNKLDSDLGKYNATKVDLHKHAFKTPTLRNIANTAPYMHNGVYNTLEEVIDFYNKGGGNGLGFKLPNQTLPEDKLNLTDQEQKALVAFMKTLTDEKY